MAGLNVDYKAGDYNNKANSWVDAQKDPLGHIATDPALGPRRRRTNNQASHGDVNQEGQLGHQGENMAMEPSKKTNKQNETLYEIVQPSHSF